MEVNNSDEAQSRDDVTPLALAYTMTHLLYCVISKTFPWPCKQVRPWLRPNRTTLQVRPTVKLSV